MRGGAKRWRGLCHEEGRAGNPADMEERWERCEAAAILSVRTNSAMLIPEKRKSWRDI